MDTNPVWSKTSRITSFTFWSTTREPTDLGPLLGSIFSEKVEFDGKNYRTRSFNTFFEAIFQETMVLQGKKKPDLSKKRKSPVSCP